jgi:hypothetical protein
VDASNIGDPTMKTRSPNEAVFPENEANSISGLVESSLNIAKSIFVSSHTISALQTHNMLSLLEFHPMT